MLQLCAPHTWPAALFPVLLALAYSGVLLSRYAQSSFAGLDLPMVFVLLCISVLFQSAVNTINDYFDYVKGTDTLDNQDDPTDAVLVYNNINPKSVLALFFCLIAGAFLLGVYCVYSCGLFPLVIALIGALVVVLYSGGRTPLSYLPVGEAVSGLTMGFLITLASVFCLLDASAVFTEKFGRLGSWGWTLLLPGGMWGLILQVFVVSLPTVIGIALIMLTNNTCDIDKDMAASRRTLPVLIGHERSRKLYHALIYLWLVLACAIPLFFTGGYSIALVPFLLLAVHPFGRALLSNPLTAQSRGAAFAQCMSFNVAINAFYVLSYFVTFGMAQTLL